MESFGATVIATALPAMADSFDRVRADLGVGLTSYLQAPAVCIPVSDWVPARAGPRTGVTQFSNANALEDGLASD